MYVKRPRLFLGLGLLLIPIAVVITLLQWLAARGARRSSASSPARQPARWAFLAVVDRHDVRAARARPRPGGDGVRARRDRRGPSDRRVGRLPARAPARPAAARRDRDLRRGLGPADVDRLPHPDRDLARDPLVPARAGGRARGPLGRSGRSDAAPSSSAAAGSASARSSGSAPRSHSSRGRCSARS